MDSPAGILVPVNDVRLTIDDMPVILDNLHVGIVKEQVFAISCQIQNIGKLYGKPLMGQLPADVMVSLFQKHPPKTFL